MKNVKNLYHSATPRRAKGLSLSFGTTIFTENKDRRASRAVHFEAEEKKYLGSATLEQDLDDFEQKLSDLKNQLKKTQAELKDRNDLALQEVEQK